MKIYEILSTEIQLAKYKSVSNCPLNKTSVVTVK